MLQRLFNVLKSFLILQYLLSISHMTSKDYDIWSMLFADLKRQRLHSNITGQLTQSYVNQHSTIPSFMQLDTLSSAFGIMVVISWSRNLQITGSTWSSHMSLIITGPARDLLTSSFHPKILHASTSSLSPPLWALLRIVLSSLQPHLSRINSAINQH